MKKFTCSNQKDIRETRRRTSGTVCKLEKSLYGLKQSPRCWNKAFWEYLKKVGFTQTSGDACVYIRKGDTLIIIAVYVDDLIILTEMQKIKDILKAQFKMKDMIELHYCLGVGVVQDKENKQIWLHQGHYIEKIVKKFGQTEAKTVSTPADLNVKLEKNDGVSKTVDPTQYQSIVGSLLYAAIATRQILPKQWELYQSSVKVPYISDI